MNIFVLRSIWYLLSTFFTSLVIVFANVSSNSLSFFLSFRKAETHALLSKHKIEWSAWHIYYSTNSNLCPLLSLTFVVVILLLLARSRAFASVNWERAHTHIWWVPEATCATIPIKDNKNKNKHTMHSILNNRVCMQVKMPPIAEN